MKALKEYRDDDHKIDVYGLSSRIKWCMATRLSYSKGYADVQYIGYRAAIVHRMDTLNYIADDETPSTLEEIKIFTCSRGESIVKYFSIYKCLYNRKLSDCF